MLVHSGNTPHCGHYYSYVRGPNNDWYKANDDQVSLNRLFLRQIKVSFKSWEIFIFLLMDACIYEYLYYCIKDKIKARKALFVKKNFKKRTMSKNPNFTFNVRFYVNNCTQNRIYRQIKSLIQKKDSERLLRIYSGFRKSFLFQRKSKVKIWSSKSIFYFLSLFF